MPATGINIRLFLVVVAFVILGVSPAFGQDGGFDTSQFQPPMDNYGLFSVETTKMYRTYHFGAGLHLSYLYKTLEINKLGANQSMTADTLINHRLKMDLSFAVALCKYYEFGFDLPFVLYQDATGLGPKQSPSKAVFGDLRLHNKFRALNREEFPVGLALVATIVAPTSDGESYFGNDKVGAELKLVLDGEIGPVLLSGNFGYRIRDEVDVFEISNLSGEPIFTQQVDDELLFALGAQYNTPLEGFSVIGELSSVVLAEEPFKQRFNTSFIGRLGARYELPMEFSLSGAVEFGLVPGYGTGPAGFIVNLGWRWDKPDNDKDSIENELDQCPEEAEDLDGFKDEDGCPDIDNDEDKILDIDDQCPDDAEDIDDFYDEDGCPDLDNDQDTILDADDKCPLAAEDFDADKNEDGCPDIDTDKDGIDEMIDACPVEAEDLDKFEDEDGCPDPDNDQDGVLDVNDKCPFEAEDKDDFQDDDGCPEPDNDKDGVLDVDDKCKLTAETINGNEDEDGCPDEGEPMVIDKGDFLLLKQQIEFEGATSLIKRSSFTILDQVTQVIKARGKYDSIIIEGHTDNRGDKDAKQSLSESRANMVKAYIANRGISEDKLEVKAFGGTKPVASNLSYMGRKKNNRIEFLIIGGEAAPVGQDLVPLVPAPALVVPKEETKQPPTEEPKAKEPEKKAEPKKEVKPEPAKAPEKPANDKGKQDDIPDWLKKLNIPE